MTEIEIEKENKAIAQEYKELLRISYQKLTAEDKKLIRKEQECRRRLRATETMV
jgi:GTP pyrophosphokinase